MLVPGTAINAIMLQEVAVIANRICLQKLLMPLNQLLVFAGAVIIEANAIICILNGWGHVQNKNLIS
jgi:hypothetical protein